MASNSGYRNRRITRQSSTICICCNKTIESDDKYAEVYPCGHDYCTDCLLNEHAMRGASPLQCKCGSQVTSHITKCLVEMIRIIRMMSTMRPIENERPFTLLQGRE